MLRIRLFGRVEVEVDGARLAPPSGRRAWALLSWLALHPGPNARARVAAAFWPDMPDAAARQNLRSAVRVLRLALTEPGARHLKAGRDQLGLDPPEEIRLDLDEFADLASAGRLAEAVAVARAELLAEFDDDWVQEPRERLRAEVIGVLERLALRAETDGDPDAALAWTRRQAELAPQAEEPQRRLMARLVHAGDVPAALASYARFRNRLRQELRVSPSTQLRRLAEELSWRPAPSPAGVGALIAREDELRRLLGVWRRAQDGEGVAIALHGDAGVGKTRLAMELIRRARADAARVAVGAALDLGAGTPLSLWAELVGNLLGEVGAGSPAPPADATWPAALEVLVPDLELRLGRSPRPRVAWSPELERVRLFEATVAMLEWLAGHGPVLLVVEDVHAADAVSVELLGHVARRVGRLPLLLVLTRRPLPRRGDLDGLERALRARGVLAEELVLGPLDDDATVRIARSVAPGLPAAQLDRVRSAAQGNPLIAAEWARALARGERRPPESLRGVVRAALAPLSEDARRLADLAAVAGRPLSLAEIESLDIGSPADAGVDVLDTVLSSDPYWALLLAAGKQAFDDALWDDWVRANGPVATPGAVAFTKYARRKGVEIFYVSSRDQGDDTQAIGVANLRAAGLAYADDAHVTMLRESSNKEPAQQAIAARYEIVAYLGDNLNDFRRRYYVTGVAERRRLAAEDADEFGRRSIVFPNNTDGHWMRAIFGDSEPPDTTAYRARMLDAAKGLVP